MFLSHQYNNIKQDIKNQPEKNSMWNFCMLLLLKWQPKERDWTQDNKWENAIQVTAVMAALAPKNNHMMLTKLGMQETKRWQWNQSHKPIAENGNAGRNKV